MCDLCDKTVFSGGRASLLLPAPFLSKRHDTHGATRLLGPRRTLYGRKSTTFSANGQKISLLFPSSVRKTAFSTFESRFSITFSGSLPDSHCGHTSYYRNIAPHPRESPQSSTRIRSGGGRRWSTCIKRWNVATLSPKRRGDTARPTQDDRRKPRERRRSPKSRQVGDAGKSSVLHPKAQRRRQAVEHLHQAVERRHALPQAEDAGGTTDEHATRRVGRSVAGVDQNPLASRHLHQARQSRPPGRRPSTGRAGKAWRNHVEAERIFARGNGRMRPRSGRFERGHGRLSALGGKKQHPLRAPGRWAVRRKRINVDIWKKFDVVNEKRAPLRRTSRM